MIQGIIYTENDQKLILPHVMKTSSVIERMQGLLFRPQLKQDQALLIQPCSSIHTIGMHYDIDVVFLTRDFFIKKIFINVKPWRCAMAFGSAMVLEMLGGNIERFSLKENMKLKWEPQ